ncbi:DUF5709 domain-containing protein [Actinoallomurus sp. NPDC052308]|uniref:DUF5709 domain-containing protein n=1 Tax=Actinoallomurus sp. NPDC052308 TaxID=3155530 RepID=UPI003441F652
MTHPHPDPDPYSELEEEGIPDLEDSYPERQWAEDPQRAPVPRDEPVGVEEFGTTAEEQREGESLDARLRREQPDPALGGRRRGEDRPDAEERDFDPVRENETPRRAGRLVEPDEGVRADTEKDAVAEDVGPDQAGFSPEEQAMRIEDEGA